MKALRNYLDKIKPNFEEGGKFHAFQSVFDGATSNSKLKEVYEEIDKLEKTKLNVKEYSKRDEEYHWFALAAFLCVLLEVLLRNSVLKKIP